MDRDIALQILSIVDDINTALETIATNITPETANNSRSVPVEEPVNPVEETDANPVEVRKTTKK